MIQGSILDLLYSSNIVVSTYSTAIIDALCLKKPVIHVEFAKIKFVIPLGNAVITSKLEDLSKNVLKLVENDRTRIQLVENAKNLIKEQYNIPIEKPDAILKQVLTQP